MKRIVSFFVVLAVIFTQMTFITTVSAADISADGSYTLAYELVENGDDDYLSIVGFSVYPSAEYTLTIPATAMYGGVEYPVRAISDNAFSVGCTSTYKTQTVTYKKSTGYYNDLLKGVIFEGSNLESIGANAFAFCSNAKFTELTIPNNVTTIGKSFNYCTRLEKLTFGEGLALMPYQTIIQCNELETIIIKADDFKFDKIGSIYVAKGMKNIILESDTVTIPGLLLMFATKSDFDSYTDTGFCFKVKNKAVYDAIIEAGYTSDYVTYDLPVGTEFVVPSSDGTYSLEYTVSDNGVTLNGFSETPEQLVDLVIPSTVTEPATGLTFNVTETAQEAFGSTNVKSAVVPGSINTFGTRLFKNCTNLESVELQEGITYLNFHMFYGCTSLTELAIPSTVTSIDLKSIEAAHNLATVKILGENVTFSNKILSGKSCGGTIFYVKNETVKAAVEACADNTNTTYKNCIVTYNEKIQNDLLTGLQIGKNVTTLGTTGSIYTGVFVYCPKLTVASIPDTVTSFGKQVFFRSGLVSLEIGKGVTSMDYKALSSNKYLVTLKIYATNLHSGAFYGCGKIAELYVLSDSLTVKNNKALEGLASGCVLYVKNADVKEYLVSCGYSAEKIVIMSSAIKYNAETNKIFVTVKENIESADLIVAGFNGIMDEIKVIKVADLVAGETYYYDFPFTYNASKKYKIFLFNNISDSVPLLPLLEIN